METDKDPGTDYPTEESDGTATTIEKETTETTEKVETGPVGTLGGEQAGDGDEGADTDAG